MTPKLTYETPNFFIEAGWIHKYSKKLEDLGIQVVFQEAGMRVTAIGEESLRTEIYTTASELRSYLHGLEDGFWSPNKALFSNKD